MVCKSQYVYINVLIHALVKILSKNLKTGIIKVEIEHADDLWVLHQIIEPGDVCTSSTVRKIKLESNSERAHAVIKRWITMDIVVEKVEFSGTELRVLGTSLSEIEDVPKGSYHTLTLVPRTQVSIKKQQWFKYQLQRLDEATIPLQNPIILCVFDRENAFFAKTLTSGFEILSSITGQAEKKDKRATVDGNFFEEVITLLHDYEGRYQPRTIILASPGFWKNELLKYLKDPALQKKILFATCSDASEHALTEVMQRPEIASALAHERIATEIKMVEAILTAIAKNDKVVYGLNEVEKSANAGSVQTIALTDGCIAKAKESSTFYRIEQILRIVDSTRGEITLISSLHEGGKKLDGIGGIAALLRY